jgi:predicted DNA-binding transcriptional regulator AlpA
MMKPAFLTTKLADLPAGSLLDERSLADVLSVSPRTLRRMVSRFELPPGVKLGARKLWTAGEVLGYLKRRGEDLAAVSRRTAARLAGLS